LALLVGLISMAAGIWEIAAVAGCLWLAMTVRFFRLRLQNTSRTGSHIGEMAWTSIAIPPLAVFWRMVGALRFRTLLL